MIKQGTLVVVDWLDAEHSDGWTSLKKVEALKPVIVHSVGWVVTDTELLLVLAACIGDTWKPGDTVGRAIVLPRSMVQKVRRL